MSETMMAMCWNQRSLLRESGGTGRPRGATHSVSSMHSEPSRIVALRVCASLDCSPFSKESTRWKKSVLRSRSDTLMPMQPTASTGAAAAMRARSDDAATTMAQAIRARMQVRPACAAIVTSGVLLDLVDLLGDEPVRLAVHRRRRVRARRFAEAEDLSLLRIVPILEIADPVLPLRREILLVRLGDVVRRRALHVLVHIHVERHVPSWDRILQARPGGANDRDARSLGRDAGNFRGAAAGRALVQRGGPARRIHRAMGVRLARSARGQRAAGARRGASDFFFFWWCVREGGTFLILL